MRIEEIVYGKSYYYKFEDGFKIITAICPYIFFVGEMATKFLGLEEGLPRGRDCENILYPERLYEIDAINEKKQTIKEELEKYISGHKIVCCFDNNGRTESENKFYIEGYNNAISALLSGIDKRLINRILE